MERLTKRGFNFTADFIKRDIDSWSIAQAMTRLQKYEDSEEQGLLLKLPCKVGDTVYRIIKEFYTRTNKIISGKVYRIALTDIEMQIFIDKWQSKGIYGKTVFLTQAEAEEALRKMNETEGATWRD